MDEVACDVGLRALKSSAQVSYGPGGKTVTAMVGGGGRIGAARRLAHKHASPTERMVALAMEFRFENSQ